MTVSATHYYFCNGLITHTLTHSSSILNQIKLFKLNKHLSASIGLVSFSFLCVTVESRMFSFSHSTLTLIIYINFYWDILMMMSPIFDVCIYIDVCWWWGVYWNIGFWSSVLLLERVLENIGMYDNNYCNKKKNYGKYWWLNVCVGGYGCLVFKLNEDLWLLIVDFASVTYLR